MSTISEAMRYMKAGNNEEIRAKAELALQRLREISAPKFLYAVFPILKKDKGFELEGSGLVLSGNSAETMLSDCDSAAVMICTLGFGFESELRTLQARNMADALIFDACGSALVEEGCDIAEGEIAARLPGKYLTDRFSPGYGDLPLSLQEDILRILNAQKKLGVHLTDSLLFNPCKTVSAILGISDRVQPSRIRGCDYCKMKDICAIRKSGGSCGK